MQGDGERGREGAGGGRPAMAGGCGLRGWEGERGKRETLTLG